MAERRLCCRGSWTVHRLASKLLQLHATSGHEPYQTLPRTSAAHAWHPMSAISEQETCLVLAPRQNLMLSRAFPHGQAKCYRDA